MEQNISELTALPLLWD